MCHFCALLVNDETRLNGLAAKGTPAIVTYAFAAPADLPDPSYAAPDAALMAGTRTAVAIAAQTAGVRFVEVESTADEMMTFAYNGDRDGWSWAFFPRSSEADPDVSGGIAMNRYYGSYQPGSGGFQVLLHEIGHAMGLKHPHDGSPRLPNALDSTANTLMSYNWRGPDKAAYQWLDRAALQSLYGEPDGLDGVETRWDAAHDTLHVRGTRYGDALIGVNDSTVLAGRGGRDSLMGRADDDTLRGHAGADTLRGNDGNDRLVGGERGDSAWGGWHDDRLFGNGGLDTLRGGAGDDWLRGGPGQDHLFGGPDDDSLMGDGRPDVIFGGAGDDRIVGGQGEDTLTGGAGADIFVLRPNQGADRIVDFDVTEGDRLNTHAFGLSRQEAVDRLVPHGDHMIFDTGSDMVKLVGNAGTIFIASDFIA